jgi:osmotically inducible lipoprotein OsmB
MNKSFILAFCLLFTSSFITSCTNNEMGTVGGAAVGGVAGSALTGGSALGTVAGAVGGGVIGNQMSR